MARSRALSHAPWLSLVAVLGLAAPGAALDTLVGLGPGLDAAAPDLVVADEAETEFLGMLLWPVTSKVTSVYWECRDGCARYHRSVDFGTPIGTYVYSARSGKVSNTYWDDCGGYTVEVDHAYGLFTRYLHLDDIWVYTGQSVTTSTVLGESGNTGSCTTGPHLHFEVRQTDKSGEPKQFIPVTLNTQVTRGYNIPYAMKMLTINTGTLNVRNGPGTGFAVIKTAQQGEKYVSFGTWKNSQGETWYAINFNGQTGYVHASYILISSGEARRVTTDGGLTVRSGAGNGYGSIGTVYGAQEYFRVSSAYDTGGAIWYKIYYDGSDAKGVGWIKGSSTSTVSY